MEYLVELFLGRPSGAVVAELGERLQRADAAVRFREAILVPEDETCFLLCDADSAAAVERASRLASIPFERVVEALSQSFFPG